MAATTGTMYAIGIASKRRYNVDLYIPDATGGLVGFNPSGLASSTSPNSWRAPEDVVITDVSVEAKPTASGMALQINQATANGGALRFNNQLNSLNTRGALALPIRAGDFVGFTNF